MSSSSSDSERAVETKVKTEKKKMQRCILLLQTVSDMQKKNLKHILLSNGWKRYRSDCEFMYVKRDQDEDSKKLKAEDLVRVLKAETPDVMLIDMVIIEKDETPLAFQPLVPVSLDSSVKFLLVPTVDFNDEGIPVQFRLSALAYKEHLDEDKDNEHYLEYGMASMTFPAPRPDDHFTPIDDFITENATPLMAMANKRLSARKRTHLGTLTKSGMEALRKKGIFIGSPVIVHRPFVPLVKDEERKAEPMNQSHNDKEFWDINYIRRTVMRARLSIETPGHLDTNVTRRLWLDTVLRFVPREDLFKYGCLLAKYL